MPADSGSDEPLRAGAIDAEREAGGAAGPGGPAGIRVGRVAPVGSG